MPESNQPGKVEQGVLSAPEPLSILFFDVETSPMLVYAWQAKTDYISYKMVRRGWFMHCWAAKWAGQPKVLSGSQTREEALAGDDFRIASNLANLVRGADVVVAHNGDRFDVPKLRNRLIKGDGEALGPVETIDTLRVSRQLGFSHNNLDHLAREFGLEPKIKTDFELWERVYDGDEVAMRQMVKYCQHDVVLLEQVFDRLRPHATKLRRLYDGEGSFCPNCGSDNFQKRGHMRTQAGTAQRFRCNECGRYFKDKTSDAGKRQMRPV